MINQKHSVIQRKQKRGKKKEVEFSPMIIYKQFSDVKKIIFLKIPLYPHGTESTRVLFLFLFFFLFLFGNYPLKCESFRKSTFNFVIRILTFDEDRYVYVIHQETAVLFYQSFINTNVIRLFVEVHIGQGSKKVSRKFLCFCLRFFFCCEDRVAELGSDTFWTLYFPIPTQNHI